MCRVSGDDDDLTGGESVAAAAPPQLPPSFLIGALYGFWGGRIRFVRAASPRDRDTAIAAAVARFFSRSDGNGDGGYEPVTSRGGLVVLRRARVSDGGRQAAPSDLCVCDPWPAAASSSRAPGSTTSPTCFSSPATAVSAAAILPVAR